MQRYRQIPGQAVNSTLFKKKKKKKVFWGVKWISFQCQKKVFLLHAYLNKNSKNNNITQK